MFTRHKFVLIRINLSSTQGVYRILMDGDTNPKHKKYLKKKQNKKGNGNGKGKIIKEAIKFEPQLQKCP